MKRLSTTAVGRSLEVVADAQAPRDKGTRTREPREPDEGTEIQVGGGFPCLGETVPLSQDAGTNILTGAAIEELGRRWGEDEAGYFPCPLPAHHGRARFIYEGHVACLGCCEGPRRSLAEVWAAISYGADSRSRSNIELATWWRRLAYDLGCFQPVEVEAPSLPPDAPPEVHRVRQGFVLLVGLRWADHPPRPVAFSVRFAAAWCGLSKTDANLAIRTLLRQDAIREADRIGRIRLYEPGDAKPLLVPKGDGGV